jgi:hypothetical protein
VKACPEPRRRTIVAALVGLGLAAAIIACGGTRKARVGAPPTLTPQSDAAGVPPTDPRGEIEQLDTDIKASLEQLEVPAIAPWSAMSGTEIDVRPLAEIRGVCTPPARPSQTCADVCTVSTHICDNADRICVLAGELQPDEWATGKCEDGKQSCEAARKRCCDCL